MPCGRTISTMIRITSAIANLRSAAIQYVLTSDAMPTTRPPTIAPYALPRPPSTTAANIVSSNRNPMFHCTPCETPSMTPPSAASAAPPTQTASDDPLHVDARRRREIALVGDRPDRGTEPRSLQSEPDCEQRDETDRHDHVGRDRQVQRPEVDRDPAPRTAGTNALLLPKNTW